MNDCMIFRSHFCHMVDVTELPAVIYQGMGGNNIQNLLKFQVIIVPDSFPGEGFVIYLNEAYNAVPVKRKALLFYKLVQSIIQRIMQKSCIGS